MENNTKLIKILYNRILKLSNKIDKNPLYKVFYLIQNIVIYWYRKV